VIRWCSYCQTFLDEVSPRDDFRISHSLCDECAAKGRFEDKAHIQAMRQISIFYRKLQRASDGGDLPGASALVDEGLALGLKIRDLAWGVLQPLLWRIGQRWAAGEVSLEDGREFSATVRAAIEVLMTKDPALPPHRQHPRPEVLLVLAEGNLHDVGLRLVELGHCLQGVDTHTVPAPLGAAEILALARRLRPRLVGVSVSLPAQLSSVLELQALLGSLPGEARPRLVIGGQALRFGLSVPAGSDIAAVEQFAWNTRL
jgi:methanogenic corrinoid protein MtbC1